MDFEDNTELCERIATDVYNIMMKLEKILVVVIGVALLIACGQRREIASDRQDAVKEEMSSKETEMPDTIAKDSFTVIYRQPVKGYQVRAVLKPCDYKYDSFVTTADISFTKEGKSFYLHTECFGDTMFCKGRLDFENIKLFKKYCNKTVYADYHGNSEGRETMLQYAPFFFRDVDFDGKDELVIVHYSLGIRSHNGYDVYRIVDGDPVPINYPPYNNDKEDWGFGMTDYPEFDFRKKTISCPYPEGPGGLPFEGRKIYGISKKQKDTVVVNGRRHLFNHIEPISEIEYKMINEQGNERFEETIYRIVDGRRERIKKNIIE